MGALIVSTYLHWRTFNSRVELVSGIVTSDTKPNANIDKLSDLNFSLDLYFEDGRMDRNNTKLSFISKRLLEEQKNLKSEKENICQVAIQNGFDNVYDEVINQLRKDEDNEVNLSMKIGLFSLLWKKPTYRVTFKVIIPNIVDEDGGEEKNESTNA